MQVERSAQIARSNPASRNLMLFILPGLLLAALTAREWGEMFYQWWNVDTYSHILLVPFIIGWLVWLRRDDLRREDPGFWPLGLGLLVTGLAIWFAGRLTGLNIVAHAGTVAAFAALVPALLGLRIALILALPLAYSIFLVPFGQEIVPPLQFVTAEIAVWLTRMSGVPAVVDGIYIDTPAGLFIVAEACAGVQFVVAMVALGTLAAFTGFSTWRKRGFFLLACILVPIVANGIRAWATIYVAQFVGAEAATGFDHIVYGWIFFGIVIAIVLGISWRWFDRSPEDAGWTRDEVGALRIANALSALEVSATVGAIIAATIVFLFAVAAALI